MCELETGETPAVNYNPTGNDIKDAGNAAPNPMIQTTVAPTDGLPPEVKSITITTLNTAGTIADADKCTDNCFEIDVEFTETMKDVALDHPNIAFAQTTVLTPSSGATLEDVMESYDIPDVVFTFAYDILDNDIDQSGIDVTITNAKDASSNANQMHSDSVAGNNLFDIDTFNPFIPTSTLTIVSSNQFAPQGNTDFAKDGDTVTITLTANEKLIDPLTGDTISANNILSTDISGDVDVSIGASPNDNVMTITYDVDTGDTEGATMPFSIIFRDEFENKGGLTRTGTGTNAGVPETVDETDTTDSSNVLVDTTPPTTTTVAIQSTDAANAFTYERVDQDIILTCTDVNGEVAVSGCFESNITGDITDATGPESVVTLPAEETERRTFTSQRGQKDISVEFKDRAENSVSVPDSINLDAIITEFTLTDPTPTSTSRGEWEEVDFTVKGKMENPLLGESADKMLVDFKYRLDFTATFDFPDGYEHPSPAQCVTLTPDDNPVDPNGDRYIFEATTEYPRPTQDNTDSNPDHTHIPEATLVLGGCTEGDTFALTVFTPVTETSVILGPGGNTDVDRASLDTQETLERPNSVLLDPIEDPFEGNVFSVTSLFRDDIDLTPIPGKTIQYFGDGAETSLGADDILPDSLTSAGVILEDDNEVEITGGVAFIKTQSSAKIKFASNPGHVTLTFQNLELHSVEVLVSDANTSLTPVTVVSTIAPSNGEWRLPIPQIIGGDGISEIEIIEIVDYTGENPMAIPPVLPSVVNNAIFEVTRIQSTTAELAGIDDITFGTVVPNPTSITFNLGGTASDGTAPAETTRLLVDARFTNTADPDYEPSNDSLSTSPIDDDNENGADEDPIDQPVGIDDDGDGAVDEDPLDHTKLYNTLHSTTSGLGGSATIIPDSGVGILGADCSADDSDGDAICDDWENNGLPFVSWGEVWRYPIPDANVGTKDVFIEIDKMNDVNGNHSPDPAAITAVESAFSAGGVALHILEDDNLTHVPNITVWRDFDNDPENDFNSIKSNNFGTYLKIRPTITQQTEVNTITPTNAGSGQYNLVITGLTIETALNPNTTPVDRTRGQIVLQVRITTNGPTDITVVPGTPTIGTTNFASGLFYLNPNVVAVVQAGDPNTKIAVIVVDYSTIFAFGKTSTTFGFHAPIVLDTMTIPFTLGTPANAPLGCTSSSTTDCTNASTQPAFPTINSNLKYAWSQIYRYILFAHSFGGPSGQAELRGNDAVVTLGEFDIIGGHGVGSTNQQAGTLAHEIGHLLGLQHGGPQRSLSSPGISFADSSINCKPNYPSVMSYSRQMDTFLPSPFVVKFSDGSHGGNPIDPIVQNSGLGIVETTLTDGQVIPGTSETIVWGTPLAGTASDNGLSGVTPHDWEGDGTGSTPPMDVNDFGISGCFASGPTSIAYFDYDDFANMDFDFRAGPSGQFDGITIHTSDLDPNQVWQSVLGEGTFDGLDVPPSNESVFPFNEVEYQEGESMVAAGSRLTIRVDILDQNENNTPLQAAFAHVFVSKNPDADSTSSVLNMGNPEDEWVQVTDDNPDNFGSELMLWDPDLGTLEFDWKTAKSATEFGLAADAFGPEGVEQPWFIRVVLFDPDNEDDDPDSKLGGEPNKAESDFLVDDIAPHLPAGVKDKATMQVELKLPRTMKEFNLIDQLTAIRDDVIPALGDDDKVHEETVKGIDKTIEMLEKSLEEDKYWVPGSDPFEFDRINLNQNEGSDAVFNLEKDAAKELAKVLGLPPDVNGNPVDVQEPNGAIRVLLQEVLDMIYFVDVSLAEKLMEDASTTPGGGTCLANAVIELENSVDDKASRNYELAILHLAEAWKLADQELEGRACDPIQD